MQPRPRNTNTDAHYSCTQHLSTVHLLGINVSVSISGKLSRLPGGYESSHEVFLRSRDIRGGRGCAGLVLPAEEHRLVHGQSLDDPQ